MEYKCVLIQVDELWLKGKNRPIYFKKLKQHLVNLVRQFGFGDFEIKNEQQRFSFISENVIPVELIERLSLVPGVNCVNPALKVDSNLEAIFESALLLFKKYAEEGTTFKVKSKRIDKGFSPDSMELNRQVAGKVLSTYEKLSVDIKTPQKTLEIKVFNEFTFVSLEKIDATKGLPIGTCGHIVTMLSGGFDSPVASFLMSKRGCKQTFVFFHAYPFVGDEVKEKIESLMSVLARFQNECELWVVPFGDIQKAIGKSCKEEYRTIFFRKFMFDVSSKIAKQIKAKAILTGDALGQVSSQTIDNISMINKEVRLPIFRPLMGFNKQETISIAKKIGTHDISVIPHDDACSLFAPKRPIIKPNWFYWDDYMRDFKFEEEVEQAVKNSEIIKYDTMGNKA